MSDYVSHLADKGDPRFTACGEPWQGWQEPDDAPRGVGSNTDVLPPHQEPRPHIDRIRQCQACLRRATRV